MAELGNIQMMSAKHRYRKQTFISYIYGAKQSGKIRSCFEGSWEFQQNDDVAGFSGIILYYILLYCTCKEFLCVTKNNPREVILTP